MRMSYAAFVNRLGYVFFLAAFATLFEDKSTTNEAILISR